MADITLVKISALPAAEQIGAEDLLPVVQEGATKAVAYGVIKDDIANELAPDATLSEAGKAADAKAVGDALALKADKTELTAEVSRIDAALATKANTNDVNAALATKANTDDVTAALALKADTATVNAGLSLKADKTELTAGLATKQNVLTFDSTPTQGSTNPVTSGGIYQAIPALDDTLTVAGDAADAKITGDAITELKNDFDEYKSAVGYNALGALDRHTGTISAPGTWGSLTNDNYQYVLVPIKPDDVIDLGNGTGTGLLYAVLRGYSNPVSGDTALFSSDTAYNHRLQLGDNTDITFIAPNDAAYLYILVKENGNDKNILTFAINGIDMLTGITNVIDSMQSAKVDKRKADPLINSAQDIKSIFEWEQYGLESAGTNSTNANQIRTKYFVWCNAGTKFEKLSGNANIGIAKYSDKTGTLIAYEYWKSAYTLDEDCYVRLVLNNYTDLANVWDTISIDLISSEFFIHNSQLINAINAKMNATSDACGVSGFDINDFQTGNITYTSNPWTYAASNVRVCTKEGTYIRLLAGTKVSIAEGYRAYFGGVVNGALFESGWVTGAYVIRQTGDYTVIISFVTQSKVCFYVENAVGALSMTTAKTVADLSGGILGFNADREEIIPNLKRRANLTGGNNGFNVNPPILTIAHATDTHGNAEAFSRYMTWCNAHADYIDDKIITGDIVQSKYDDSLDFFTTITGHEDVLLVLGNHDQASGIDGATGDNYMSQADAYAKYFAPFISNWGVTYTQNLTYWYKDYTDQGIRLIGLNTNYRRTEDAAEMNAQITWLETVLQDALTNNLAVVIAQHYPFPGEYAVKYNSNFCAIDNPVSLTGAALNASYCDAVEDFINDGGEFICWFGGHTHCDFTLTHSQYPNQLNLILTCLGPADGYGDSARVLGERSQDAFNILAFDRTKKTIKVIRIGSNSDLYIRGRNVLTVNYQTKATIYSE